MAKKLVWMMMMALALMCAVMGTTMAAAPSARASHILVKTEDEADKLAAQLAAADDLPSTFAELAREYSSCPSSRRGGDLGTFGRGAMVPEFDTVCFEKAKGVVHKVKTQFGWHLVLVTERSGVDESAINSADEDEEDTLNVDL